MLNKNLGAIRQSARLTQSQVAKQLGITQGLISQWESGACYPHTTVISKLAKLYGVSSDDILAAIAETRAQEVTA